MKKCLFGVVFVTIFLWPLHSIVNNINFPYNYAPLTKDHQVGSVITLPYQSEIKSIYLNGVSMSHIKENNLFLGVIGIINKNHILIHGEWNTEDKSPFSQLWSFPQQYNFKTYINLLAPLEHVNTTLRLPSSIWKRVNDDHVVQKKKEREMIRQLYNNYEYNAKITCWDLPLKSQIISQFAAPRRLPNGNTYNHTGVDLRSRSPQAILAPAPGEIVYEGHMIVPGNNVMIYHGNGIYSRYLHLSEIHTGIGKKVKKGDILGYTGMTGRVEGPHLHWEVLWKGQHSDPLKFVKVINKLCDKTSYSTSL